MNKNSLPSCKIINKLNHYRCTPNSAARRKRAVDANSSVEASYNVVMNQSTTAEAAEQLVTNVTTVEAVEKGIVNVTVQSISSSGKLPEYYQFSLLLLSIDISYPRVHYAWWMLNHCPLLLRDCCACCPGRRNN